MCLFTRGLIGRPKGTETVVEDADKNIRKQRCSENKPTAEIKWLRTGEKGQAGKFLLTSGQECMCSTSHSCDILHAGGEVSPTSILPTPPSPSQRPASSLGPHRGSPRSQNRRGGKGLGLWMNLHADGSMTMVVPTGMNWSFFNLKVPLVTCIEGGGCV